MKAEVNWQGDMEFAGRGETGHEVIMDASESAGGHDNGSRPLEMLLYGLGGCTGMDVASILKKMKAELSEFKLEIEAETAEDHPHRFTEIHINYKLRGKGLTESKVKKAVNLSQEKYCSASASLNVDITGSFEITSE